MMILNPIIAFACIYYKPAAAAAGVGLAGAGAGVVEVVCDGSAAAVTGLAVLLVVLVLPLRGPGDDWTLDGGPESELELLGRLPPRRAEDKPPSPPIPIPPNSCINCC